MSVDRRLALEQLESRQLLAIMIDAVPEIMVNEGSLAALSGATFRDTSPGGAYSANVEWDAGLPLANASVVRPTGTLGPLRVTFDYRYDTAGFLGPEQRQLLQTAAEITVGRLGDRLDGFASIGTDQFIAQLMHPETGESTTIENFSVATNEIIIFVGSKSLDSENIGLGGPGGGSGREPFFSQASARGQLGAPLTDFGPWGGSISFDADARWHFGPTVAGLNRNENDFLSVAVHEIFHVLGFSPGVDSYDRLTVAGEFRGVAAREAFDEGGWPPLSEDGAHLAEGLTDDGQEAVMDPTIKRGTRKLPTPIDFAVLDDIGWRILPAATAGQVTANHRFTDDGTANGTLTVVNGNESDSRRFRVVVNNVPPTVMDPSDLSGRVGEPLNIGVGFTDPGTADTHLAVIDWGDGSGDDGLVDQAAESVSGSHVYSQPGTYQVQVGVEDDDGDADINSFVVTITAAPRGDWQNPDNAFDVSRNSVVDPLDALLVINELNEREFSDPATGILPPAPVNITAFLDVTGDDIVSPQDALQVINVLSGSVPTAAASLVAVGNPATQDIAYELHTLAASHRDAELWADSPIANDDNEREDLLEQLALNLLIQG